MESLWETGGYGTTSEVIDRSIELLGLTKSEPILGLKPLTVILKIEVVLAWFGQDVPHHTTNLFWRTDMARTKKRSQTLPPPPPNRKASVLEDPPRKNVLLLSCMDQRLLDETIRFMNGLNLHNRYDQVALAGSAMGVNRLPKDPPDPACTWWELFTAHLSTAIDKLHRPIKDVFLLDHLDCGAYKELHPIEKIKKEYSDATLERMHELHADELIALANRVHDYCDTQYRSTNDKAWEHIRVSCFIVDLCGHVNQLDS